ncbi:Rho GTPase-activating protein 20 [Oryzias melastigma]|uniref:Rho GTPase-activating protein 20 n=1 Tax=Oryzias melastigma TaxID=30732 RepID=A0A834F0S5_ORYME|nr:Rho GTPase-activating protein 20 [Oryzias melastigma]
MTPLQGTMGQNRSESLTGDNKYLPDSKKKMKTLAQRRQSAPSLVISKALTRSRSTSRETCLIPVSPETCPLIQAFLAESAGTPVFGPRPDTAEDRPCRLRRDTSSFSTTHCWSSTHFKVKSQVRVCEMWTANCMEEVCEGSTNPDRSFVLGWPTCNYVATFRKSTQCSEAQLITKGNHCPHIQPKPILSASGPRQLLKQIN